MHGILPLGRFGSIPTVILKINFSGKYTLIFYGVASNGTLELGVQMTYTAPGLLVGNRRRDQVKPGASSFGETRRIYQKTLCINYT